MNYFWIFSTCITLLDGIIKFTFTCQKMSVSKLLCSKNGCNIINGFNLFIEPILKLPTLRRIILLNLIKF